MSFQTYIINIEQKTEKSIDEIVEIITKNKVLDGSKKPSEIINWIKVEFDLGLGYARAIYAILKNRKLIK